MSDPIKITRVGEILDIGGDPQYLYYRSKGGIWRQMEAVPPRVAAGFAKTLEETYQELLRLEKEYRRSFKPL